jgi:predicted transcriptional regulator
MVNVRIPDDLRDKIDAVRGDVPRERWIRRALEQVLALYDEQKVTP